MYIQQPYPVANQASTFAETRINIAVVTFCMGK